MAIVSILRCLRDDAVNFLYPPVCPLCGVPESGERSACDRCREALDNAGASTCRRCSAPVGPNLETGAGCIHCRGTPFAFERVASLGVYTGALRRACLRAKSSRSPLPAHALGDLLAVRLHNRIDVAAVDLIVPVPSHWTTRFGGGHSTPEALAHRIARFLKAPLDSHILRKVRRTAPQASLPPSRRRENLKGAFRIARGVRLEGCRVLLVDDVLTTGTTAHRASRALLREGRAESVQVAVVARGIGQ